MIKIITLGLLAIVVLSIPKQTPIIGIYTQTDESDEPEGDTKPAETGFSNYSYIAASYVKYIEMSGAQVVPLFAYNSTSYLDDILPKLNGVLFPGGDLDFDIKTTWTKNADYILKYAINQNKKGKIYPIWGTCMGMQLLAYLTSNYDDAVLSPVRGDVKTRNTLSIQSDATLLADLSPALRYNLQNGQGILYFNHHYAVSKQYYDSSPLLRNFWVVEAFTTSPYNQKFLSVIRAKDYPFFGVQFHLEKNLFEWKVYADRSFYGAEIVQILSNRFIEYSRKNTNEFDSYEQFKRLSIYNFKTQFTNQSFIQIYLFDEPNEAASSKAKPPKSGKNNLRNNDE